METNNLTSGELYQREERERLRRNVARLTDCTEPGKPVYHDLMRLASGYPSMTGYLNSTPIPSWTEEKRLRRWAALKASARKKLAEFERKYFRSEGVTTKPSRRSRARVTTKAYARFQPHPKKYKTNAERQAAYRKRHKKR
jgi:hypothetical protein